jgi:hypothetical protein
MRTYDELAAIREEVEARIHQELSRLGFESGRYGDVPYTLRRGLEVPEDSDPRS